ncbi:MAG: hypothetical protein RLZZ175_1088 [Bacteroidota bacterium]|jgi:esterase
MQLYHRELGEGKPLIIIHGLMGSSDNWLTVSKPLAEKYKLYIVDQRNHGRSFWSNNFTYNDMANDLGKFIETHKIENPIIIGHSMGGKIAMKFATENSDLIDKLIVVDIAPRYYAPHHQAILAGLNSINLSTLSSRNEADELLSIHISDAGVRQFLLKNLYRNEAGAFAWRINLEVINEQIGNIGEALAENAIFDKQTLFIRGDRSAYITPPDEAGIKKHFPKASIKTIVDCGHWVQAEQPQAFINALNSFI